MTRIPVPALPCWRTNPLREAVAWQQMGPKQELIPDTRSSPVIWRVRQSGNESGH